MIIKDKNVAEALETKGFSKLPLIEQGLLTNLLATYSTLVAELKAGGTYWSMSDGNKELASSLNKSIIGVVFPYLQLYFDDIKPIVSTFMIKTAHAPAVNLHQDWTFVNEEPKQSSFTCWMPLVDTTLENGRMGFIPGSHNRFLGYRASPSPPFGHLFPQEESLFKQMEYIVQQAGEAVVFNHRVIHGSEPNTTELNRPAIGLTFTSVKSQLVHLFLKPGNGQPTLAKYAIDEAFYDKYSNTELQDIFIKGKGIPDYEVIEEIAITL